MTDPAAPQDQGARRLAAVAVAIIAVDSLLIGAITSGVGHAISGSEVLPTGDPLRAVGLTALFLLPAALAGLGAWRGSTPLLLVAGLICALQSFVAFSGVSLIFLLPAVLLFVAAGRTKRRMTRSRERVGAVVVLLFAIGAWVAPFALSETQCWRTTTQPDGSVVTTRIPAADSTTLGPTDVAAGCDGGAWTTEGVALEVGLVAGVLAVAAWSTRPDGPAVSVRSAAAG